MRLRIQFAATLLFIFLLCKVGTGAKDDDRSEPYNYFRKDGAPNAEQIQSIGNGKVLARVLDAGSADQILVFGARRVDATPERFRKSAPGTDDLRKLP